MTEGLQPPKIKATINSLLTELKATWFRCYEYTISMPIQGFNPNLMSKQGTKSNFQSIFLSLISNSRVMKKLIAIVLCGVVWVSCQESESISDFTGNEITYSLQPGSQYSVSGTVTIKERRDGSSTVLVSLTGTSGDTKLPVHLHLGDITKPGADVAALLSPVNSKTGISETKLTQLANETSVSYAELINLEACLKVHLSDTGAERDIILVGGNIGESAAKAISSGRTAVGVCKSE